VSVATGSILSRGANVFQSPHNPPGTLHLNAGGVLYDALAQNLTVGSFRASFASKKCSAAASALIITAPGAETLCSSIASLLGAAGQANYAAANARLDTTAKCARMVGRDVVSVQWGVWSGIRGMGMNAAARVTQLGLGVVRPADGVVALSNIAFRDFSLLRCNVHEDLHPFGRGNSMTTVSPLNWKVMVAKQPPSMLDGVLAYIAADVTKLGSGDSIIIDSPSATRSFNPLSSSPATENISVTTIEGIIGAECAAIIGGAIPDRDAPLMDAGMDSLAAVELRTTLTSKFGLLFPATLLFDYPTISTAAMHISKLLQRIPKTAAATTQSSYSAQHQLNLNKSPEKAPHSLSRLPSEDVKHMKVNEAVISCVSGRCASDGSTSDVDSIGQIPSNRWDSNTSTSTNTKSNTSDIHGQYGSFLEICDIVEFDINAVGINRTIEAAFLDPRQRILIADVCALWISANVARKNTAHVRHERQMAKSCPPPKFYSHLPANDLAIFIGISGKDYASFLEDQGVEVGAFTGTGNETSTACGRLAFLFNATGAAVTIDTACSSSLVAVNMALRQTYTDHSCEGYDAIAAGVSLILTPRMHLTLGRARMLAPDGRCKTLDVDANGYGRAEASRALLLQNIGSHDLNRGENYIPMESLLITGSAVNQDGRSSSLTAPNGSAQSVVIRAAMLEELEGRYGGELLNNENERRVSVDVLQMHGTGTPLGDPIEASAANNAFPKDRVLLLGAVKSWVGHAEPAAGALGLTALAMQLSRLVIQGQCHLRTLNPHVTEAFSHNQDGCCNQNNLPDKPVITTARVRSSIIATCSKPRGGTSAFAFQGTNAHVRVMITFPKFVLTHLPEHHDSSLAAIQPCEISLLDRRCVWPVITTISNTLIKQVTLFHTKEDINARFMIMFPPSGRNIFWSSAFSLLAAAATTTVLCPPSASETKSLIGAFLSRIVVMQKGMVGSHQKFLAVDVNSSHGHVHISKMLDARMNSLTSCSNNHTGNTGRALVLARSQILYMQQYDDFKGVNAMKRIIPAIKDDFLSSVRLSAALDLSNNDTELRDLVAVEAYKIWNENIRVSKILTCGYFIGDNGKNHRAAVLNDRDQRVAALVNGKLGNVRVIGPKLSMLRNAPTPKTEHLLYTTVWLATSESPVAPHVDCKTGYIEPNIRSDIRPREVAASALAATQCPYFGCIGVCKTPSMLPNLQASGGGFLAGLLRVRSVEFGKTSVLHDDKLQISSKRANTVEEGHYKNIETACSHGTRLIQQIFSLSPNNSFHEHVETSEQESLSAAAIFVLPRYITNNRKGFNQTKYSACSATIVGGLGALGACVSSWFVGTRFKKTQNIVADNIDLLGRSGRSKVWPPAVDVSSCASICMRRFDVSSCLNILHELPILVGSQSCGFALQQSDPVDKIFVHASGVLNDRLFLRQNLATFREVCAAKLSFPDILSCRNHASPRLVECVFSSIAAILGNQGQMSYAAANAELDTRTIIAHQVGTPAISVRWGAWSEAGMAVEESIQLDTVTPTKRPVGVCRNLQKFGMQTLSPEQGLAALGVMLRNQHALVIAASVDWAQLYHVRPDLRAMINEVRGVVECEGDMSTTVTTYINSRFHNKTKESAKTITVSALQSIEQYIMKAATEIIGHEPLRDQPLMAAGIDSLGITELCSAIATYTGKEISTATFFNYPSVAALSMFLDGPGQNENITELNDENNGRDLLTVGQYDQTEQLSNSLSIKCNQADLKFTVGTGVVSSHGHTVAGIEPAYINNNNVTRMVSSFHEPSIPPISRWDVEWIDAASGNFSTGPTSVSTRFGAFLGDIDRFDAKVFGMRSSEARRVDPQQRLLLESTLMSKMLAEAGNDTKPKGSSVAVAVGVQHIEYALLDNVKDDPYVATGSALSVAAGRIAYMFNFGLTALAVDTACSASLMAVHLAVSGALHFHASDQISSGVWSVCAGVNLTIGHAHFATIEAAGMLSSDGRCKVLDKCADGYGRAEAVVTFMLRHDIQSATRRVETIGPTALFRVDASASNQDGRSSSLTAPNGLAQQTVITLAHTKAQELCILDSNYAVAGISMHGTGTTLGDPIEINSLISALSRLSSFENEVDVPPLILAASKSRAGHSEAAAGAVGLLLVDDAFASQRITMLSYLRNLSPYLVTEVRRRQMECEGEIVMPRITSGSTCQHVSGFARVGVSAFAFSGSNVHLATSLTTENETTLFRTNKARDAYKVNFEQERHWSLEGPRGGVLAVARVRHLTSPETQLDASEAHFASPPGWFPSNGSIEQPLLLPLNWLGACAQIASLALPRGGDSHNNVILVGAVVHLADRISEYVKNTFHIYTNMMSGLTEARTQSGQMLATSTVSFALSITCSHKIAMQSQCEKKALIFDPVRQERSFRDIFVAELAIPSNAHYDSSTWTAAAINAANDIITAQHKMNAMSGCITLDIFSLYEHDSLPNPVLQNGLAKNTDIVQIHAKVYQRLFGARRCRCVAASARESCGFIDWIVPAHHERVDITKCAHQTIIDSNDTEALSVIVLDSLGKGTILRNTWQNNILETVLDAVEEIAGVPAHPDEHLANVGIDSIAAVELATTLQKTLGITLDIPEIASAPTVTVIIERIIATTELSKMERVGQAGATSGTVYIESEILSESAVCGDNQSQPGIPDFSEGSTDMLIKSLKPECKTIPTLFLGAPAFGDGQIAYMRLVSELQLGRHPVRTLERDVAARPWPEVAAAHAHMIHASQPEDFIAVGGHSLGGVLAVESAMTLELKFDRDVICFLFDAPHPVQFKSEWNDTHTPCSDATIEEHPAHRPKRRRRNRELKESTGLTYMEVALASFHYDTRGAGWSSMSRDEKYSLFEAVTFQAVGRRIDAKQMDEEISSGPYANQWNSGIIHNRNSGQMDMSSWQLVSGHPESTGFRRLRSRVFTYKAGEENDALFAIDVLMPNVDDDRSNDRSLVRESNLQDDPSPHQSSTCLQSIGGYAWVLACDNVEVVHCQGNHMNILTMMTDGGDLEDTIIPHLSAELDQIWNDIDVNHITCTTNKLKKGDSVGLERNYHNISSLPVSRIHSPLASVTIEDKDNTQFLECTWAVDEWHLPKHSLPLWKQIDARIGATFESIEHVHDSDHCRVKPETKIPVLDACVGRAVLGLNEASWSLTLGQANECTSFDRPIRSHQSQPLVIVFIQDLMEGIEHWSADVLKANVPVIGVHLPSSLLAEYSLSAENMRTEYKNDQTGKQARIREEHAAAVVLASVRAVLLTEDLQKTSGIAFAALQNTPAARVALNAAVQCRMRGDIDAAAFTLGSTKTTDTDEEWFDFFEGSDTNYDASYQIFAAKYAELHTAGGCLSTQQRHNVNVTCLPVVGRPREITPQEWDAAISEEMVSFNSLLKIIKASFK
jgi:acyl transferase domain-containing protein/acyl carrier protein